MGQKRSVNARHGQVITSENYFRTNDLSELIGRTAKLQVIIKLLFVCAHVMREPPEDVARHDWILFSHVLDRCTPTPIALVLIKSNFTKGYFTIRCTEVQESIKEFEMRMEKVNEA